MGEYKTYMGNFRSLNDVALYLGCEEITKTHFFRLAGLFPKKSIYRV